MKYILYIDWGWVYFWGLEHPAFWKTKYADKVYFKAMPTMFRSSSIYVWRDSFLALLLAVTVRPIVKVIKWI